MQPADDSVLLRQFAESRSDEAFAALVARHINLVYSVALRQTGQPQHAEEITQAVFIILAKKAAGLRHERALTSWLFQTTRLTANNFIRSEMRRLRREKEVSMQSVLDESAHDIWPRISPLLDNAVGGLREKDRRAILLRFYEGRNLREIGAVLGTNEDASEKRVSRALEKLRKFFLKRGVDSTAAAIGETISVNSVLVAPAALAKATTAVALAKGAMASVSTLTLIKGALKIMAWSKAKTVIGVGILLVAGVSTVTIKNNYFPSEPSYQGRRLSEWIVDIDYGQPPDKRAEAGKAIRQMGVKTLPFLVADLADKHPTNDHLYRQATWAFDALGPIGKPAIPKLTKLLEQNPGYVPGALAGIGQDALPELLNSFTNGSFWVRDNTAAYLANAVMSGKISAEDARPASSIAIRNLQYENTNQLFRENTRWRAAGLIEALHLEPAKSVPALLVCLQESMDETNYSVAAECALALSRFGSDAQPAIPSMIKSMEKLLDEPTDVTLTACETQFAMALGNCGRKAQAAIPVLIKASNSTNATLSQIATQSLKLIQ